jgi:hypothetical protein
MSASDSLSRYDFLQQIWAICTTLTEETMRAATARVAESGLDPNRGVVPLAESFINLTSARAILEDAIEKQKLVQLPITVQKELLANLETISKSLQGLISGVDEIANLTNAIETLNTSIWKFGLHNLSDQVLGYQKKLNQLKTQELQISNIITQLDSSQSTIGRLNTAAADLAQKNTDATSLLEQVKQSTSAASSLLEQIKVADTQTNALYATVQQHEKQSGELTSNVKTMTNELTALDVSVRKFYGEADEYRKKISQTTEDASKLITNSENIVKKLTEDTTTDIKKFETAVESRLNDSIADLGKRSEETIGENQKKTEALVKELAMLKEQVKAQIQQATGFALFGAFQARQNQIVGSKKWWAIAIAALVIVSVVITSLIAYEAKFYNAHDFAFWIKLSLTLPLGYAIAFCTLQYSRERRLEEEYAFKASISVSLTPYRDLVHSILKNGDVQEQSRYTEFVISSITNVFTSPTDRVFESEKKESSYKTLKQAAELVGTVAKAAK